jgi:hypothetical protein
LSCFLCWRSTIFFWMMMMAKLNFPLYTRAYYKLRFPLSLGLLLLPHSSFSSLLAVLFVSRYGSHRFPPVSSSACISVSLHTIASPLAYIYTFFGSLSTTSCLSSSLSLSFSLSSMDLTSYIISTVSFPFSLSFITACVFYFPPFLRLFVCLSSVKTPRVYVALQYYPISHPTEKIFTVCLPSTLDTKTCLSSSSFQRDLRRASYNSSRPFAPTL